MDELAVVGRKAVGCRAGHRQRRQPLGPAARRRRVRRHRQRAPGSTSSTGPASPWWTSRTARRCGGHPRPSSEVALHLPTYRVRPDANALVHLHPQTVGAARRARPPDPAADDRPRLLRARGRRSRRSSRAARRSSPTPAPQAVAGGCNCVRARQPRLLGASAPAWTSRRSGPPTWRRRRAATLTAAPARRHHHRLPARVPGPRPRRRAAPRRQRRPASVAAASTSAAARSRPGPPSWTAVCSPGPSCRPRPPARPRTARSSTRQAWGRPPDGAGRRRRATPASGRPATCRADGVEPAAGLRAARPGRPSSAPGCSTATGAGPPRWPAAGRPGLYELTGHWPARRADPAQAAARRAPQEPERWAATARVLFVHDWLLHRLARRPGRPRSSLRLRRGSWPTSRARPGRDGLLDRRRARDATGWPTGGRARHAGRRARPRAAPPARRACRWSPAAATPSSPPRGAGGLADGVVTVVAGSSTPVQVASTGAARPAAAPLGVDARRCRPLGRREQRRLPGTRAGLVGRADGRADRRALAVPGPGDLLAVTGVAEWSARPGRAGPGVAGRAAARHDVARTSPAPCARPTPTPYAATSRTWNGCSAALRRPSWSAAAARRGERCPRCWPRVLGRPVHWTDGSSAAALAGHLGGPGGGGAHAPPGLPGASAAAGDPAAWEDSYARWGRVTEVLRGV